MTTGSVTTPSTSGTTAGTPAAGSSSPAPGSMAFTGLGGGIRTTALVGALSLIFGIALLAASRIPVLRRRLSASAKKRRRRIARA